MARTSADQVSGVIEVESGANLDPFIETASALVDSVCVNSDYDDDRLELIERWLSAHFYAVNAPRNEREGVLGVYEWHEPIKVGYGLRLTKWGQTAMNLDFKGNLAGLENGLEKVRRQQVGVQFVGGRRRRWS